MKSSRIAEHNHTPQIDPIAVSVADISYSFTKGTKILDNIDLEIPAGAFWTLLGSSGSGKTTLLRLLAGLLIPDTGSIRFGSRDVTRLEPQRREIGFVFQNYALFPHLNVTQNLEFPLRLRKVPRAERQKRVQETLELVHLTDFSSAYPAQLSGGQQQRVAVARALIFRPSVMLLDEPLGALDKGLRQRLGANLREIQQATGITAVYVTHDQEEAFSLSDGVAVMSDGRIEQVAAPATLYRDPASTFVARFLGETNLFPGTVQDSAGLVTTVTTEFGALDCRSGARHGLGSGVQVSVRPEDFVVVPAAEAATPRPGLRIEGRVARSTFLGSRRRLNVTASDRDLAVELSAADEAPEVGESCYLTVPPERALVLAG